jgi:hypothetical protein
MSNGKKVDTAKKLTAEDPLPVPGPMLGKKGRLDPLFVRDDTLQTALKKVIEDTANPDKVLPDSVLNDKKKKERYAFAVVDLTFESAKPVNVPGDPHFDNKKPVNHSSKVAYAGWNDRANLEVCSTAKLLPLYAAFQLRADMRGLFQKLKTDKGGTAPTMTELKDEAKKRYEIIYAGLDITRLIIPDLAKIFTLDGGAVNFVKVKSGDAGFAAGNFNANDELSESFLIEIQGNEARKRKVKFYEHVRLMVEGSDDFAASLVIDALGYEYMWAVANRSGLFRSSWDVLTADDTTATGSCGLFLAARYEDKTKRWAANDRPAAAKGIEIRRQANARSLAILLTMLGRERLIDHESHVEMDEMMRRSGVNFGGDEDSPIGTGMNESGWENQQATWDYGSAIPALDTNRRLGAAKIGYWLISQVGCCCAADALLVRTKRDSGKILTAVLIAIDNADDKAPGLALIRKFGKEIAKELDARHS